MRLSDQNGHDMKFLAVDKQILVHLFLPSLLSKFVDILLLHLPIPFVVVRGITTIKD